MDAKSGTYIEVCKFWYLVSKEEVHQEILDLEDNVSLREDPAKLMYLSVDG